MAVTTDLDTLSVNGRCGTDDVVEAQALKYDTRAALGSTDPEVNSTRGVSYASMLVARGRDERRSEALWLRLQPRTATAASHRRAKGSRSRVDSEIVLITMHRAARLYRQ